MFFALVFHSKIANYQGEKSLLIFVFLNPGVSLLYLYPCFDNHSSNNFCDRSPACVRPYITFLVSTYTLLLFRLFHILLWHPLEKCSVSAKCINIAPVVCSRGKNWYLVPWILIPGLILCCRAAIWLWLNWMWVFHNRQDIWFCSHRLLILLRFSLLSLISYHKLPCRRWIL